MINTLKQLWKYLFSMPFMVILLGILALAMAVATFIENSHTAVAAQGLIYKAWWFDLAIVLIFVNLLWNIFRFKLYTLKKLPIFLFHASFLLIILGGALTRFVGEEGTMNIREGETQSQYQSFNTHFYLHLKKGENTVEQYQMVYLTPVTKKQVGMRIKFGNDKIRVKSIDYVPGDRMQMNTEMSGGRHPDVVRVKFMVNNWEEEILVQGFPKGQMLPNQFEIAGIEVTAGFGVRIHEIPFALHLNDFQLERYAVSMSPSSYASEVTLIDESVGLSEPHRIYMNNILRYRKYRIYQSGYDPDEKGTILSVNHDILGTTVTYVGYFIMMGFIVLALFTPGSRFRKLIKTTGKNTKTVALLLIIGLGILVPNKAQSQAVKIDPAEARHFGKLWIQGSEGRYKPVNTLANEIIRKITGDNHFKGYSAEQFCLSLMIDREYWETQKLFEITRPEISNMINLRGDKASFSQFFSAQGYMLNRIVNEAYAKKPNQRNQLDKQILKLDEKVNVFYMAVTGQMLKLFPHPTNPASNWFDPVTVPQGVSEKDSLAIVGLLPQYLMAVNSGDYDNAVTWRTGIANFQEQYASELLPTDSRASLETMYNRLLLFERLTLFYAVLGILFLVLQFLALFKPVKWYKPIGSVFIGLGIAGFIIHSIGLALRWYISGHAPMSNGYESMIFVAWGTLLAGILVARRSRMSMALTIVLAALTLLVAHMSWMNPEITPLVPVLKSVWLTIHVAVIMTSYSFLGLGALIGLVAIILFALKNKNNHLSLDKQINHLTRLNKMVLIVGLYLITIGCFLGAIWANEAWGRYWGWDPKETWCLITILVYSIVIHMNKAKGFASDFSFNIGSLIGFASVLMTYFGVNYFLGGMHSYAGGDVARMPVIAYVLIIILVILAYVAYFNQARFEKKESLKEEK